MPYVDPEQGEAMLAAMKATYDAQADEPGCLGATSRAWPGVEAFYRFWMTELSRGTAPGEILSATSAVLGSIAAGAAMSMTADGDRVESIRSLLACVNLQALRTMGCDPVHTAQVHPGRLS